MIGLIFFIIFVWLLVKVGKAAFSLLAFAICLYVLKDVLMAILGVVFPIFVVLSVGFIILMIWGATLPDVDTDEKSVDNGGAIEVTPLPDNREYVVVYSAEDEEKSSSANL